MEKRFVLHRAAAADLIVRETDGETALAGLFIRAFNDAAPVGLWPRAQLSTDALCRACDFERGSIRLNSSVSIGCDVLRLELPHESIAHANLIIPSLHSELDDVYLGLDFECSGGDGVEILRLEHPNGMLIERPVGGEERWVDPRSVGEHQVDCVPDAALQFACFGEGHPYGVILRCIEASPSPLAMLVTFHEDHFSVAISGAGPISGLFTLFVRPTSGRRLLGRHLTAGISVSSIVFAVYPPWTFRVAQWLACAVTDLRDRPLSLLPVDYPQSTLPNIVVTDPKTHGWLLSSDPRGRRQVENARVVMLVGNPSLEFWSAVVECGKYEAVVLVAEDRALAMAAAAKVGSCVNDVAQNGILRSTHGTTDVYMMWSPDLIQSREHLEELILQMVRSDRGDLPSWAVCGWEQHIQYRLPALPFCPDLALGMIALVGNMLRGRLPDDDGTSDVDYAAYSVDELWLVPWGAERMSRQGLLTELNVRIAAEYTACRALSELWRKQGPRQTTRTLPSAELCKAIRDQYASWQRWARLAPSERTDERRRFAELVEREHADPTEVLRVLAAAALVAFREDAASGAAHRDGLTHCNPLVIVYAPGGDESNDPRLDIDSTYWAMYAAHLSGSKPGLIVPTLRHREEVAEALQAQVALRLRLRQGSTTAQDAQNIQRLRQALGNAVGATLEPATFDVLSHLGADRVVAFSDVALDFVPFCGSVLGLEFALSRLPTGIPASMLVESVAANSCRLDGPTRGRRAALLRPVKARPGQQADGVLDWASRLTNHLAEVLWAVGLVPEFSADNAECAQDAIDAIGDASIVCFCGHAMATRNWAALDLGGFYLSVDDICQRKWHDSLVFLMGCETAAADVPEGDIARAFLQAGARAVVGTSGMVSVDVAHVFFGELFHRLTQQMPVDLAFLVARRKSVLYEVAVTRGMTDWLSDNGIEEDLAAPCFSAMLDRRGLAWTDVFREAVHSLTFTLLGGAGEPVA